MREYFKEQLPDAIAHAKSEFPNESCGAIIEGKYVPFENRADDKSDTFLINDVDFNQAYMDGKVECVIHSHNDYPHASVADQIQQRAMDIPFGIINLKNRSVIQTVFWGDSLPIQSLEGRPFFFGVYDCYALVRDWIRINLGYTPPNPEREWCFWLDNISMYEDFINNRKVPFDFIPIKDAKYGDVLLYRIYGTKFLNHCGVISKNGLVLHHFVNELSGYKPVSYFREYCNAAMRFNPDWEGFKNDKVIR